VYQCGALAALPQCDVMYSSSVDEKLGLIVGVYRGSRNPEEDYASCIASIVASDANAASRRLTHTCVLVTDADTPPPPPIWRQRMAETNNGLRAERYNFVLVTPKLVLRGVFTAITWLTRRRPGHQLASFPDVEQAADWVQNNAGQSGLAVRRLHAEALRRSLEMPISVRGSSVG
jgi:hypothetical protein